MSDGPPPALLARQDHFSRCFFSLLASFSFISLVRDSKGLGPSLVGLSALGSLLVGAVPTARFSTTRFLQTYAGLLGVFSVTRLGFESNTIIDVMFVLTNVLGVLLASRVWGETMAGPPGRASLVDELRLFARASSYGQLLGSLLSGFLVWNIKRMRGPTEREDDRFTDSLLLLCAAGGVLVAASQCRLASSLRPEVSIEPDEKIVFWKRSDANTYNLLVGAYQFISNVCMSMIYVYRLRHVLGFQASASLQVATSLAICAVLSWGSDSLLTSYMSSSKVLLAYAVVCGPILGLGLSLPEWHGEERDHLVVSALAGFVFRVAAYALAKPMREALFGLMRKPERDRVKPVVDGFLTKCGTAFGSFLVHASPWSFSTSFVLVGAVWVLVAYGLTTTYEARRRAEGRSAKTE